MARRLQLQTLLEALTENETLGKVYFQPPNNFKMQYPCIVYTRYQARSLYAGNKPYLFSQRYAVTVIDRDPDGKLTDLVAGLPLCSFERHFATDNLNHDVYNLYF